MAVDLLEEVEAWTNKGFSVTYIVIDQYENGYRYEVDTGDMPRYTYTFSIYYGVENELWYLSLDSLTDGFTHSLTWLNRYGDAYLAQL